MACAFRAAPSARNSVIAVTAQATAPPSHKHPAPNAGERSRKGSP